MNSSKHYVRSWTLWKCLREIHWQWTS